VTFGNPKTVLPVVQPEITKRPLQIRRCVTCNQAIRDGETYYVVAFLGMQCEDCFCEPDERREE
jgi:hypothetical protein